MVWREDTGIEKGNRKKVKNNREGKRKNQERAKGETEQIKTILKGGKEREKKKRRKRNVVTGENR